MPTLEKLIQQKKKPSKLAITAELPAKETKASKKSKAEAKPAASSISSGERKPNTIELVETKVLNEEKKKKNYEKQTQVNNFDRNFFFVLNSKFKKNIFFNNLFFLLEIFKAQATGR